MGLDAACERRGGARLTGLLAFGMLKVRRLSAEEVERSLCIALLELFMANKSTGTFVVDRWL
jgi:hypothetical protein